MSFRAVTSFSEVWCSIIWKIVKCPFTFLGHCTSSFCYCYLLFCMWNCFKKALIALMKKRKNSCWPFNFSISIIFFFLVSSSFLRSLCLWIAQYRELEKSNHTFSYTLVILLKFCHSLTNVHSYSSCKFVLIGTFVVKL